MANVGQPAVSHSVRQLESMLGVKLFRRQHRGVELTGAGEQLAKRVSAGLHEIRTGIEEVRVHRDAPTKTDFAGFYFVSQLLADATVGALQARAPGRRSTLYYARHGSRYTVG